MQSESDRRRHLRIDTQTEVSDEPGIYLLIPELSDQPLAPDNVSMGGFQITLPRSPSLPHPPVRCSIMASGAKLGEFEAKLNWAQEDPGAATCSVGLWVGMEDYNRDIASLLSRGTRKFRRSVPSPKLTIPDKKKGKQGESLTREIAVDLLLGVGLIALILWLALFTPAASHSYIAFAAMLFTAYVILSHVPAMLRDLGEEPISVKTTILGKRERPELLYRYYMTFGPPFVEFRVSLNQYNRYDARDIVSLTYHRHSRIIESIEKSPGGDPRD